jgi:hypothetical protein|tara:strand:+ start:924 stop:1934 length:1011 start_codon:yes stop_codon:yes gene_type:complete
MYCNNLEDLILKRHDYNQANELLILGGFIGVLPVEKVSKEKIKTTVIYGCMKNANLNEQYHEKYINLTKDNKNLEIYYKKNYNHSKIYCWIKDKKVVEIIAGSANFSISGLQNDYQESLFDIKKEDYSETYKFIKEALEDSELCTEHNFIHKKKVKVEKQKINNLDQIITRSPPAARLSLRSGNGTLHDSGINVGQKKLTGSHVHIDDCYVPLRAAIIDELPELFPNQGINVKVGTGYGKKSKKLTSNAEFLFDDGEVIAISFEQKGPPRDNGNIYKAFRSFKPNSLLGQYLRKRMNIKSGQAFTELDFKKYGRDNIDLTLLAEGQYYADFSVKNT